MRWFASISTIDFYHFCVSSPMAHVVSKTRGPFVKGRPWSPASSSALLFVPSLTVCRTAAAATRGVLSLPLSKAVLLVGSVRLRLRLRLRLEGGLGLGVGSGLGLRFGLSHKEVISELSRQSARREGLRSGNRGQGTDTGDMDGERDRDRVKHKYGDTETDTNKDTDKDKDTDTAKHKHKDKHKHKEPVWS